MNGCHGVAPEGLGRRILDTALPLYRTLHPLLPDQEAVARAATEAAFEACLG